MNILILTTKPPYPPKDGGAIATLNMATGLAELDHHVTVLAMNTEKHFSPVDKIPRELQEKITFHVVDADTRIRWPLAVWNLFFSHRPYHSVRFRSGSLLQMLRDLLSHNQFDIIQFEGPYLDYCIPIIRKTSKAKISLRAHNIEHEIWERRAAQTKNPFKRFYFSLLSKRINRLERSFLYHADMVIPISVRDHTIFQQLNPDRIYFVCPTGIDIHAYPEPEPVSVFSLFYIGALDWGPNTEGLDWFFKHVWTDLITLYPSMRIHIAGRNSHYYFSGQTRQKGVIMEGEVEDAHQFINSHSVMIVPLFSGSGIRIKILEAMLLGRTVITTTTGAKGLNVTHKKNILIANLPAEFIQYTGELMTDTRQIKMIGKEARRFVKENFDNLVMAKQLAHFYKEQMK
jgi:glycosyltransferase involved in cell wall biosynthesis